MVSASGSTRLVRSFLPPPDLIIWLKAEPQAIAERFQQRSRRLSIAQTEDIGAIEGLLNSWLEKIDPEKIITVDGEKEDRHYATSIQLISSLLAASLTEICEKYDFSIGG